MNNKTVYERVKEFKYKYPATVAWRIKRHCKIINKHLNPDEDVLYAFVAQKNDNPLDFISTYVIVLTNKRLMLARKRFVFGYFLDSITPDMFNDMSVIGCIIWGKVHIDTVKEYVTLSNISKKALPEIETQVSSYMMKKKEELACGLKEDK